MPSERRLTLRDRLPACRVTPPPEGGLLALAGDLSGRLVLDHGCGDAHRRKDVERLGGTYVGLDPYSASSDLLAPGDRIPLRDESAGVVISNAVLHLVPNPRADVAEIGRVLQPGGVLVGYVGFLEGDPEQARFLFSHLALAETLEAAGLKLEAIAVAAYGIDLQLGHLLVPFGTWPAGQRIVRRVVRGALSLWMSLLSAALGWRLARREGIAPAEARRLWRTWLHVSHAAGFTFLARKPGVAPPPAGSPVAWDALLRCPRSGAPLRRVRRADVRGLAPEADPAAAEWLVAEGGRFAYPVAGSQLALSAARGVEIS